MSNRREFIQAVGLAATGVMAAANAPAVAAAPEPNSTTAKTKGAKFRELLQGKDTFESISVHDVLSARLTEMTGFRSLMLGSSAVSEFLGVPDWSIASDTERIDFYGRVADSVNIPAFADLDEGGFTPLTLYRSTKAYERAGVGAIHLCDGKAFGGANAGLFTQREMVDRIKAAMDARSDMVVTARCQGWNSEGKDKTLERANAYREGGVEAIWYLPMKIEDVPDVVKATNNLPVMFIMNANTTLASVSQAGVKCAVYATLIQNIASNAVYNALLELKTTGLMTKSAANNPMPRDVRQKLTDTDSYTERAKKYEVR